MLVEKELIQKAKEKLGDQNFLFITKFLNVEEIDEARMKCKCPVHHEDTASFI